MEIQNHVLRLLTEIQHSTLAHAITKSNHLVIAGLQIVHVLGFLLLLSSLLLICLRLLGLIFTETAVARVVREPLRLFLCGLVFALGSGMLLFLTGTAHYYFNRAFDTKMVLLLVALLLHFTALRAAIAHTTRSRLAKASAVASLLVWFGVGIAGRAIGFV